MYKLISTVILSFALSNAANAGNDLKPLALKSKAVVKEFMTQLGGELKGAMKAGGPVNAINVCNKKAPVIAKALSAKYGWKVARTSLKTRNSSNAPDAWETQVLNKFEERKANGEAVKPMAYFEAVDNSFRFMKAIPTGEICLKCHGENIAAPIKAKLKELYPNDMATGYKLGDVRGAFTITQPM